MRRVLVTGSSGHLGEALMRALSDRDVDAVGLDVRPSEWTHVVGSVADARLVRAAMAGVDVVLHAATLHKPQVAFLPRQAFVDTNVGGTWRCSKRRPPRASQAFVMTSSTTVFGDALIPALGESGRLGRRDGGVGAEEHLRRHQGGRRGPVPARASQ